MLVTFLPSHRQAHRVRVLPAAGGATTGALRRHQLSIHDSRTLASSSFSSIPSAVAATSVIRRRMSLARIDINGFRYATEQSRGTCAVVRLPEEAPLK